MKEPRWASTHPYLILLFPAMFWRLVFMDEGEIVEDGAPDVVLRSPQHPRTQGFLERVLW